MREAPRLWWLLFEETIRKAGFIPLHSATGVFVLKDEDDNIVGILAVHADGGLWAGEGPRFEAAKDYLRAHLYVKK